MVAMVQETSFRRAFTIRSFGGSLFSMVMLAGMVNFGGSIEGAFLFVGEEAMPLPALWMLLVFSLVSGLVYMATRRRLFTRPEMFFILFSSLVATPMMNAGFWRYIDARGCYEPAPA